MQPLQAVACARERFAAREARRAVTLGRPLGMLETPVMMLPLREDVLPNVTDEELRAAAERVGGAIAADT